jgi:hypothetical protein
MTDIDEKTLRRDHDTTPSAELWDIQLKGVNYLLVAHAAGLVTCLTLMKDYPFPPTSLLSFLNFGLLTLTFGGGLFFAIIAFALVAQKMYELQQPQTPLSVQHNRAALYTSGASCLILLVFVAFTIMMGFLMSKQR